MRMMTRCNHWGIEKVLRWKTMTCCIDICMRNTMTSISSIIQTSIGYRDWKRRLKASTVAYKSWRLKLMN
jgi:hypothetical protein